MFFVDPKGNNFDPDKKFGLLNDGNQLLYDEITTSYEVNLPPDYYLKYIQEALPNKDERRWFIRPHHLESLTNHFNSLKDDILNTRYFSHYNKNYGVKPNPSDNEKALEYLGKHIDKLRMKMKVLSINKYGKDMEEEDIIEKLREDNAIHDQEEFDKFIKYKGPLPSSKELCIKAYEGILFNERNDEKEQLNKQRFKEYERNRPPADKWYQLKSKEFTKELYRNRVALKPNNSNKVYLDTLQDPYLY